MAATSRLTAPVRAVRADVAGAWVWRETPPPLRDVARGAKTIGPVPGGSAQLRASWVVWNYAVAVPMTAVLYGLAWVFQHPLRTLVAAVPAAVILTTWIL